MIARLSSLINRRYARSSSTVQVLLGLTGLILAIAIAQPAYAAGLAVDSTADTVANDGACTLREAILNANNDDQSGSIDCAAGAGADAITIPAGTYTLDGGSGHLLITADVAITGAGAGSTIIQANTCDPAGGACTHTHRVFSITGVDTNVNISDLTIQNGRVTDADGGGIAVSDAAVTINRSTIRNNQVSTGQGGGIFANRSITISNSTITNNQALYDYSADPLFLLGRGGGLYASGAQLDNSVVSSNQASVGGGGIFNNGGTLTLQNSSLAAGNDADGWGGGIFNYGGSLIVNDSSLISDNTTGRGGGIYTINTITNSAYVTLTGTSLVQGNWSAFFGGGLFNRRAVTNTLSVVTLADSSQIFDNRSDGDGGGVYNWGFSTAEPNDGAALYLLDSSQVISNTGKNGGGVYLYENSALTVSGGQITSNIAQEKGGGVYVRDGFINATSSSVMNNSALLNAGGLYLERGAITLSDTQVDENAASGMAGGIYIDAGTLAMNGGSVSYNHAVNAGGGLVVSSGHLILTATEVIGNKSVNAHGGGFWNDAGSVSLTNAIINNNQAKSNGGGIQNSSGVLMMHGGQVEHNTATGLAASSGGALFNIDGQATFTQTVIADNTSVSGGGIRNLNATAILRITQGEIVSNTATTGNGGALLINKGEAYFTQTTLANNQAGSTGGAIRSNNSVVVLINSTISNNSATGGGALYTTAGPVTLSNTTVTGNTGDAIAQLGAGPIYVSNIIIANTIAGNDCSNGLNLVSNGHNLASDSSCTNLTATGDRINTDPLLGPLQDNGGPTLTHALLAGSAAIDAGDNAVCAASPVNNVDQRGVVRPQGTGCDIGAVEALTLNSSVTSVGVTTSYNPVAQACAATGGALPIYTITAMQQNSSAISFTDLFFRVKTLEYTADQGGLVPSLCNATTVVDNGGVGSMLAVDNSSLSGGDFSPGDTLSQAFAVGLPIRVKFRIFVDLFSSSASAAGSNGGNGTYVGSLVLTFDPNATPVGSGQQIFVPLVTNGR